MVPGVFHFIGPMKASSILYDASGIPIYCHFADASGMLLNLHFADASGMLLNLHFADASGIPPQKYPGRCLTQSGL